MKKSKILSLFTAAALALASALPAAAAQPAASSAAGSGAAPSSSVSSVPASSVSSAPASSVSSAPASDVSSAPASGVSSAPASGVSSAPASGVSSAPASASSASPETPRPYIKSDTTVNFSVTQGQTYAFRFEVVGPQGLEPHIAAGDGKILRTEQVRKVAENGHDVYYFSVRATGDPGQASGIYTQLPGQDSVKHCAITVGAPYIKSDTTVNFSVAPDRTYAFRFEVVGPRGLEPHIAAGDGSILRTEQVRKVVERGNDVYYFQVRATGNPGQASGIYTQLPGQDGVKHCAITVGAPYVESDTTVDFNLPAQNTYAFQFIVHGTDADPHIAAGNGSVLRTENVRKVVENGNNVYYFSVRATGDPGQASGIYTQLPGQDGVKHCTIHVAENPALHQKIWIDAGHGGYDSGAGGNGRWESNCTLDIALRVEKNLTDAGISVGMSRTANEHVDLHDRPRRANNWGADYFVSIHLNDNGGYGAETWCQLAGGKSREMAQRIQDNLVGLGYYNRGVKTRRGDNGDYLAVLRETDMPACLVECGFIDNFADMARYNPQRIADAISDAILAQIGYPNRVKQAA